MFCDQDDTWDKNKIDRMVYEAEKIDKSKPFIVHANCRIVDENGAVKNADWNKEYNTEVRSPLVDVFFSHRIHGCNLLMNRKLFVLIQRTMKDKEYYSMGHDTFSSKVCAAYNGKMIYVDDVLMSYRRHGKNVTAAQKYEISLKRILDKITHADKASKDLAYLYWCSIQSAYLLLKQNDLPRRTEVEDVYHTLKRGGLCALRTWSKYHIDCGNTMRTISHLMVLVLGRYKKYFKYDIPEY